MNTWQRIGQVPEHFAAAHYDATRGSVRAVVLEYQPQKKSWWAYERTYNERAIPLTKEHQKTAVGMTPQERAICSLLFVVDGGERMVMPLSGMRLSQALALMEVPLDLAGPLDRASPLW